MFSIVPCRGAQPQPEPSKLAGQLFAFSADGQPSKREIEMVDGVVSGMMAKLDEMGIVDPKEKAIKLKDEANQFFKGILLCIEPA